MAINTTTAFPEEHHFYPDSAINTPYEGTADAGEFFSTLLDMINPLQHIPMVSTLYRELTGDDINPAARMVGGAVFGGPIGFASASANVLLEQASGTDVMGHAIALFSDDTSAPVRPDTSDLQATNPIVPEAAKVLQVASMNPATPEPEEIVWNGPRFLAESIAMGKPTLLQSVMVDSSTPNTEATTGAQLKKDTPDWLEKSRDAAQRDETARASGNLTPARTAQPWVANAMFDALEKYEALAKSRSEKPDNDIGS